MKITAVETFAVSRFLFVKVTTDEGISGIGESGAWGHLEASRAAITKFSDYLVGKDPMLIEHHYQYMYRFSHFRGAAIYGALSAIDIALWDIKGKFFGVQRLLNSWSTASSTKSVSSSMMNDPCKGFSFFARPSSWLIMC